MRGISTALRNHLAGNVVTPAYCVLLIRPDGLHLGFTSLPGGLWVSGIFYESNSGIDTGTFQQATDMTIDNLEIMGILSSDRITDADLRAGLYDDARMILFLVNYKDLSMGQMTLLKGVFGEITIKEGVYVAEFRVTMQLLMQDIVEVSSATCRVSKFGDMRCSPSGEIDLATYTETFPITFISGDGLTLHCDTLKANDWYRYGVMTITSGPNAGYSKGIKIHNNMTTYGELILQEAFPFTISAGDTADIVVGCDRTWQSCRDKFDNWKNFQGEPLLPGNQQIMTVGRPPQ